VELTGDEERRLLAYVDCVVADALEAPGDHDHPHAPLLRAGFSSIPSGFMEETRSRRKTLAIEYLRDLGKPLSDRGVKVLEEIAFGAPADEILEYARKNAVDLIAISTHGRSGIGRWVFGSVTDKVLHGGDTAILVVQAK
jgi:nucleotide-binding universal stress UspA family protein